MVLQIATWKCVVTKSPHAIALSALENAFICTYSLGSAIFYQQQLNKSISITDLFRLPVEQFNRRGDFSLFVQNKICNSMAKMQSSPRNVKH